MYMNKLWGHFSTITRHRNKVMWHCFRVGLFRQGLLHDLSKYSPEEFIPGVKYYQGYRSPNEREREIMGYSRAWMHHKGRNKHHFEYWTDYDTVTKKMFTVKMPVRYVAEMFCDRVAASKIYGGDKYTDRYALDYFLRGKETRDIHPETSALIESLLTLLAEKGEKEAFKYVRKLVKENEYPSK